MVGELGGDRGRSGATGMPATALPSSASRAAERDSVTGTRPAAPRGGGTRQSSRRSLPGPWLPGFGVYRMYTLVWCTYPYHFYNLSIFFPAARKTHTNTINFLCHSLTEERPHPALAGAAAIREPPRPFVSSLAQKIPTPAPAAFVLLVPCRSPGGELIEPGQDEFHAAHVPQRLLDHSQEEGEQDLGSSHGRSSRIFGSDCRGAAA